MRKQPSKSLLKYLADAGTNLAARTSWVDRIFPQMVARHGHIEAIERLVTSADIQPGFRKCVELNCIEATFEAAVLAHPTEFTLNARQCSEFRLRVARERQSL